jgi:plasmid replication initiation protein
MKKEKTKSGNMPVLVNSEHIFVQSNNFIQAKYKDSLSFWEFMIFGKMCTLIDPADTDFHEYTIQISELIRFLGITDGGIVYKYVMDAAARLLDRKVVVSYTDDNGRERELETNLVVGVDKLKRPRKNDPLFITLTFHPKLKPFLLQLRSDFTKFDIRNYKFLRTGTSIRIYHLLAQYVGRHQRNPLVDLEELKSLLGVANKYSLYANFKLKVLEEARKRLAETTDLSFSYEEIKNGKKVSAIQFHIQENNPQQLIARKTKGLQKPEPATEITPLPPSPISTDEWADLKKEVCDELGVTAYMFKKLSADYPIATLQQAAALTRKNLSQGKIKGSPAGFFVEAVRQQFVDIVEEKQKQIADTKQKVEAAAKIEFDARQLKEQLKKQHFEAERDAVLRELADDTLLRDIVISRIRHSLFHGSYDETKTYEENLKNPSFMAALLNFTKTVKSE